VSDAHHDDALRQRFAETAARLAALEESRREELRSRLRGLLDLRGDERVLDAGTGTGALAFALAPLVREIVAVDLVPELLAEARRRASGLTNVTFAEGDAAQLDFGPVSFDLAGTLRTLHHVPRPELVVAELARVTRLGGQVLIVDQIAPVDPLAAVELDQFERARDPSHTRLLPDVDVRSLLEANGLVVRRAEFTQEHRELESYLDLAGCSGEARQQARALASPQQTVTIGWYVAIRPLPGA
jgi:ubiquinone/menaquinone biosynthesis C-methylase UbiE